MVNWNDLRYFVAIARAGTLARAAKDLKVDQTTVGRRLAALEEDLQAQLFTRTPDGFVLTDAGERTMEIARDLDERVGLLEARVKNRDADASGVVRLAMNEHVSVGFLMDRIVRVRERHPELVLEVVTSNASVNLLRREADIAIRVAPRALPDQQGLVVKKLGALALGLYATREYLDTHPPVDVESGLEGHDVVLYEQEVAEAPPGRWLARHATRARRVLVVSSMLGAAAAASAGVGLALVPCFMAPKHEALVKALPMPLLEAEAWLLVHPELASTARVRAVVDHVVQVMADAEDLLLGRA